MTLLSRSTYLLVAYLALAACSEQAPAPDPLLVEGESVFKANCKVCHAQGINGAPIIGNKKMWGTRADQGIDTLVQHAAEGFGLMPAKGGNTELSNDQLKAAITFMLSKLDSQPE